MFVQTVMQTKVATVTPRTRLAEAIRLAQERGIRHLPVLDDAELVGIVSDRDFKRAMASPALPLAAREAEALLDRLTVADVMTSPVITVGPRFHVEEAARLMMKEKISALPVTDDGRLVGIVTETDVLSLFLKAIGATQPSSRIDVVLAGRTADLADVIRTVEATGTAIASIVTLPVEGGALEVMIRVTTINPGAAIRALEARGYSVRDSWRG